MNKRGRLTIIAVGLVALFFLSLLPHLLYGVFSSRTDRPKLEDLTPEQLKEISSYIAFYVKGKSIMGFFNSILLVYLIYLQVKIYRSTKTSFSLTLILCFMALLLYTILGNPIAVWFAGFSGGSIIQAFNFLPDLFTTVASIIFIMLSRE
jgi:ABC-type dipeptide/oligopeptide/nickel transport system permease component